MLSNVKNLRPAKYLIYSNYHFHQVFKLFLHLTYFNVKVLSTEFFIFPNRSRPKNQTLYLSLSLPSTYLCLSLSLPFSFSLYFSHPLVHMSFILLLLTSTLCLSISLICSILFPIFFAASFLSVHVVVHFFLGGGTSVRSLKDDIITDFCHSSFI